MIGSVDQIAYDENMKNRQVHIKEAFGILNCKWSILKK